MLPNLSALRLRPAPADTEAKAGDLLHKRIAKRARRSKAREDKIAPQRKAATQANELFELIGDDPEVGAVRGKVLDLLELSSTAWYDPFKQLVQESNDRGEVLIVTSMMPLLARVNDGTWTSILAQLNDSPSDPTGLMLAASDIWEEACAVAWFVFYEIGNVRGHACRQPDEKHVNSFDRIGYANQELAVAIINDRMGENYLSLERTELGWRLVQKDCSFGTDEAPIFVNGSKRDQKLMSVIMHTRHWDKILNMRLTNAYKSCEDGDNWGPDKADYTGSLYLPALAVFVDFFADDWFLGADGDGDLAKFATEVMSGTQYNEEKAALNRLLKRQTYVGIQPVVDPAQPKGSSKNHNCKKWQLIVRPSSDVQAQQLAKYLLEQLALKVRNNLHAYRLWQCVAASAQASLKAAAVPWLSQLEPTEGGTRRMKERLVSPAAYVDDPYEWRLDPGFRGPLVKDMMYDGILWKGLSFKHTNEAKWRLFGFQNQSTSVLFGKAADFASDGSDTVLGLLLEDDVPVVNVYAAFDGDFRVICFPDEAEVLLPAGFRVRLLAGSLDDQLLEMQTRYPGYHRALKKNDAWRVLVNEMELEVVFAVVERIL